MMSNTETTAELFKLAMAAEEAAEELYLGLKAKFAHQLANELENSEINVVFEFIITNFSSDESAGSFLRAQLRDHIARLVTEFPARFTSAASRQAVKALE